MENLKRSRTYEWIDPMHTAHTGRSMSGYDFLKGLLDGRIPPPPIAETIGFRPSALEPGKVSFEFEPKEFHYNPLGMVHGGVISTILDTALGCALQSQLPQGTGYTTLELKVNFVRAVTIKSGLLKADGRLVHLGRTTAVTEADLRDLTGKLYAHATCTCLLLAHS